MARHWGVHDVGPAVVHARDRLGATTLDGRVGEAAQLRVYADAEATAQDGGAAADAARARQPALARAGRGDRVRRPATARAGRPRPQHQLACHRSAPRPVRQPPAPGAQRGRRPVPRHLRGGRGNARRGGARRRVARLQLPRAARPRRAREPRRRAELADRQPRHEAALSHPRRAVLEPGETELPLEGGHPRAAPAAPRARAGDRAQPAAGRARHRRAARPARPRLRPRGARDRAGDGRRRRRRSASGGSSATRCAAASRRSASRSRARSRR